MSGTVGRKRKKHCFGRLALLVLSALVVFLPLPALCAEGAWSSAGSLATSRYQHTATLLPNGKILVAGGYRSAWPYSVAGAELYDPVTNSWSPAGSMSVQRRYHTATLLPNGKVLIAGGNDSNGVHATAELYDPSTNSWSSAASMASIREMHTATLLTSGKVLVVGGYGNADLATAELYDPATDSWSPAGTLTTARRTHTATLLPGGKVLVAGGGNNSTQFANAELYDPALNSWTSGGSLTTARAGHIATLLPNGKVLVAGGYASIGDQFLKTSEIYDPAINSWSPAGSLAWERAYHTATLLPNGRLLVTGGHSYSSPYMASAEQYDPATDSWSAAGSLTAARYQHTATLLANGNVVAVGGASAGGEQAGAESYDYSVPAWRSAGSMATARLGHTSTLLTNGMVLVAGGEQSGSVFATAELYNPASNTWTGAAAMASQRSGHRAVLLSNGKVLVVGGRSNSNGSYLSTAELYDPGTNSWSQAGSMATARSLHTVTLLANGKVLVAGGGNDADEPPKTAELYNPADNSWSPAGSLASGRYNHTATLLPSGKVMVAGGNWEYVPTSEYASLSSIEIYDPVANQWVGANPMVTSRSRHSASLLPHGKVLIAGGSHYQGGYFSDQATGELYDPVTDTWSPAGSMSVPRIDHTATLLPDGTILAVGGYGYNPGEYLAGTESFDPGTNSWKTRGSLVAGRGGNSATLLANGTVLIAGGVGNVDMGNGVLAGAELYDRGLGFSDSRRPVITGISNVSGNLVFTGSGFRGDSEGSGGDIGSSPADYPLVQLQRVQEGSQAFLLTDSTTNWSDGSVSINRTATSSLQNGTYLATVYVNGIPSRASFASLDLQPTTTVNPSALTMGSVYVGASATAAVTLTNTGARALQIASTPISGTDAGMFARVGGTCGTTLAAGGSCTIGISFTPTAGGSKAAVLAITSDNPSLLTVNLAGTGVLPQYPLSVFLTGTGSGTVGGTTSTSPSTLYFTTSTSQSLESGTVVTLNAAPASGSVFSGWSGDCAGTGTCSLTMTGAKTVTATFTTDVTPPVTTVTPAGGTYSSSPSVTLVSNEPATIYYTLDGSVPTTASTVYAGPITISASTTLRFFAMDAAGNQEAIQTHSYVISSSAWSIKASLPYGLSRAFSAVVGGKIVLLGGAPSTSSVISYDPSADSWASLPSLPSPIFGGATAAQGSIIYLLGGLDAQMNYLGSVIAYNTTTGNSTTLGSLLYPRARMNGTLLNNKIYVVGGSNAETTIEEFDLATNTSVVAATLPEPTILAGVAAYQGKLIIAAAGTGNTKTWSFDPVSRSFATLAPLPSTAEARNLIVDGDHFYLIDGWGYGNINYVYDYNYASNSWSIATSVPTLRNVPMVEALNGAIYVMGGDDATGSKRNEAWRFSNPVDMGIINTVAGSGTAGFSGDGGNATGAFLNSPEDVAVDGGGSLYIADTANNRIRRVDRVGGAIFTIAGNGVAEFSGDGGPALMAGLNRPFAVARDSSGNLYITDNGNYRVRKIEFATGVITTVAGNGISGTTGDGGPATAASLGDIRGLAVDSEGNIYIADTGSNGIRKVDRATGIINTIATVNHAEGVTLDSAGNLYYAETWANVVVRIDKVTSAKSIVAGNGMSGYSGDGGPATLANLYNPHRVVLDAAGNIYISDTFNNRIRKVDGATGIITSIAGTGTRGFSGDGGPSSVAAVADPRGISVDGAGNIFFADAGNQRIRVISSGTVDRTPPATIASPPGSTYSAPQWVTLSSSEPSTIYYTVDGSYPTTASPVYGGSIYIGGSMILQYFARDTAGNQEPVKTEYYTIKQNQTIAFPALTQRTYGDAPFTLEGSASSGMAVSYASDNTAVATVSGNTVTIVGAGTATITAMQWGDSYYNPAPAVTQTLTVQKAAATVVLGNLEATYDGTAKAVSATTTPSGLSVTFTYNGLGAVPVAAGSYSVIGTISSADYQGSATGTLIIARATSSVTISPSAPNPSTYGQVVNLSAAVLPAGATGKVRFSNGSGWIQETDVNAAGNASLSATNIPAGVSTITAQYLGGDNHLQSPVSTGVAQIVNKADQSIGFAAIADRVAGGADFTLNATATSGLTVTYTSSDATVATVTGSTVSIVGPGTVSIIASQWGDGNYNAATAVARTFTIFPAGQAIKVSANGSDSYFTTLSAAYGSISSATSAILRLPAVSFNEAVVFDKDLELTILGGYDASQGTHSGVTTINGSITIQGGTVIIAEPVSIS